MQQKKRPLKPILAYPNKGIDRLRLQISQQVKLLKQIKAVLPEELVDHALHCVLNNKKLYIYTDSAIWASQLRFHEKSMLATIKFPNPETAPILQVKIMNNSSTVNTKPKRRVTIPSKGVAFEIHNQSLIINDPQLKQALEKLSTTLVRLQAK
jgi:hypothetical protein